MYPSAHKQGHDPSQGGGGGAEQLSGEDGEPPLPPSKKKLMNYRHTAWRTQPAQRQALNNMGL